MIYTEERTLIKEKWRANNPQIHFSLFEVNYGWNKQKECNTFLITDNGEVVMTFTNAKEYLDKRKPNEITLAEL